MAKKRQILSSPEQLRLKRLVDQAKLLGTYPDVNWDDYNWDVTKYEKPNAHRKKRLILFFSARRSNPSDSHEPYEQPFSDFAKTLIRTRASERNLSFDGHTHMIIAFRYLYDALRQTGTTDPTDLKRKHFILALANAKNNAKGWTVYHVGKALQKISEWMDDHQLTPAPIHFRNSITHPGHSDGLDPESQARGLLKLPSRSALDALADISNNPLDNDERILMRIIDLLVVGGFRIGEVLSLPVDCWVETNATDDNGKLKTDPVSREPLKRYGIRYWPEKGGDPYVKWLSDASAPLAERATRDLKILCHEARHVASIVEKHHDRVPLPAHNAKDVVDHSQLRDILNICDVQHVNALLKRIDAKPFSRRGPSRTSAFIYRISDVEKALLKLRGAMVIVRRDGGKVQLLSESLCVMFRYQFHARWRPQKFLPELIGEGQINNALGNDADEASVFSIRGLTESDGSRMRIKTSAFRHWLNTLLAHGGLSDVELARWSGRRNITQNAAYKHGTVEQRVTWAREMIRTGNLQGPAAETYHSISDPVEKEEFLVTFVGVALFTPYGVCIHDYAIDPCPYHLNCLGGCSEYLRTKGDKEERKNISELRDFHLVQLQRVKNTITNGEGKIRNYQQHCERMVAGADSALAVDKTKTRDGQLIKVFPKGKRVGKPVRLDEGTTI